MMTTKKGGIEPISDPPNLEGKSEYLYYVGAEDCINMEQQWKQGFQMVKLVPDTQPKKARKKRNPRVKRLGNTPVVVEIGKSTKTETKAL